ncbi:MAG: lysophospholipid acyltransferase family protein, partial [Endozoicomonas sp.]
MLFFRLLGYMPFFLIYWLAWLSYLFLYYVLGYRKAVVEQNLRQAFPQKSQAEIHRLGRAFYRHLANLALEIIKARTMSAGEFQRRCSVVGAEQLLERTRHRQQPIIVLTIHQGNWEWVL